MPITDRSFYIQSPSRAGLFKLGESEVCLIDGGSHSDAAKKILRILESRHWSLRCVFNTHSHADHIGGNKLLHDRTGCRIYAPGIECAVTRHPVLEPAFLCGAFPPPELRHKFLMAEPSPAEYLTPELLPDGMEIIPLPGHTFEMTGFRTPDDVVYLADALSSREILDKYKIGFIYDVGAYLDTLERIKTMRARMFVPAHADPAAEIAPLAEYNIARTLEVADRICELCREPVTGEELLKKLFDTCGLTLNFDQYALVGSTLRSYLAWLKGQSRVQAEFTDNRLWWRAC